MQYQQEKQQVAWPVSASELRRLLDHQKRLPAPALRHLDRTTVGHLRSVCRTRPVWQHRHAQQALRFSLHEAPDSYPTRWLTLVLRIDGVRPAYLDLSPLLARVLTTDVAPVFALESLDPELATLLIEAELAELFDTIEQRLDCTLSVERIMTEQATLDFCLPLACVVNERSFTQTRLHLTATDLAHFARLLDAQPVQRRTTPALPISAALRVGLTRLSVAEMRSLRAQDTILLDISLLTWQQMGMIFGERYAVWGRVEDRRLIMVTAVEGLLATNDGEWSMEDDVNPHLGQESGGATGLDDLPVMVAFELGRQRVPLATVQSMAPGYVFDLPRALDEAVDIVVGGKVIGQGTIVQLEQGIGVQVTRVFAHE